MTTRNRLAAAAAAALALSAAMAADAPHPMVGTWAGTWTRGDMSELTISRVDDDGAVHGVYCHKYAKYHSLGVVELQPADATAATLVDGTLRFEVGTSHIEATLDGDEIVFSNRRAGNDAKSVLTMTRIAAPQCTAQYIGHTITAVSGTGQSLADRMPERPDHALVGHWTGVDPETKLLVELTVVDTDNGYASGVFCNAWSANSMYFYVLDPMNGFLAAVSPDTLKFDVAAVSFVFELEAGTLRMTRTARGDRRTLMLDKTATPTCAPRYIAAALPEA